MKNKPPIDSTSSPNSGPKISQYKKLHLITGHLASHLVSSVAAEIEKKYRKKLTVQTLPISVAALISNSWIEKHLQIPGGTEAILLPGYFQGNLTVLNQKFNVPFFKGPKEIQDLPDWLGGKNIKPQLDEWDIEIIAEINNAEDYTEAEIHQIADQLRNDGADIIDLGCLPGRQWNELGNVVSSLKAADFRVSVDSLNPTEIIEGCEAGADLILSVNSQNIDSVLPIAKKHQTELVLIPDTPSDFDSLKQTVKKAEQGGVKFRIDPILEPICMGFAKSLSRYQLTRDTWPNAEIMMGTGNISELSDVDSSGVNFTLLGFCQELGIRSVLTTQVINWARSSVKEINLARKILFYSFQKKRPPKRVSDQLVCLRDDKPKRETIESLQTIANSIKDNNFRVNLANDQIVCYGKKKLWTSTDPFEIFDQMQSELSPNQSLSSSHSFYLGFEMCKAMIANQLNKNYTQDQALNWGHLTVEEQDRHRIEKE